MTNNTDDYEEQCRKFGKIDANGTVFVSIVDEGGVESWVEVGQYAADLVDDKLSLFVKRYVQFVCSLQMFESRLLNALSVTAPEIDNSLKKFRAQVESPNFVGDIAYLKTYVESLEKLGAQRKEDNKVRKQEVIAESEQIMVDIVSRLETFTLGDLDRVNWRTASNVSAKQFERWKELRANLSRVPESIIEPYWNRLKNARKIIDKNRKVYYRKQKELSAEFFEKKQDIVARAERLKDSDNVQNAVRECKNLMQEWKQTGRIGGKRDDELWDKFRSVQDEIFQKKSKADEEFRENRREYEQKVAIEKKDWGKTNSDLEDQLQQWLSQTNSK